MALFETRCIRNKNPMLNRRDELSEWLLLALQRFDFKTLCAHSKKYTLTKGRDPKRRFNL